MADLQGYFILFLISAISIILIRTLLQSTRAKPRLPPSPLALPIIGHLHLLAPKPHQAFHKLAIKYGPIYRIFLGSTPCVVSGSPEIAKEFFKTHDNTFSGRPQNSSMDYISYGGNGFLFAPYASYWKFMKKIILSELLNGKTLDSLLPVRHDELNVLIKDLSQNAKVGNSVEIERELMKMTNNVMSRMLMSKRCSDEEDEAGDIRKIVTDVAELIGKLNISDHIWFLKNLDIQGIGKRSKHVRRRFDILIEKIMKEHEEARKFESREVKDLLSILLDISEDESMEIRLTRENIKAFILEGIAYHIILEIFCAGTDTSALTIEWALSGLINHPNVMKKAIEEIDQVVGKNRLLEESDVPNLPYLQAIIKESLRLHPTSPLLHRQSTEDCTVGGYHIPAKTTILFNIWAVGRDPAYWDKPLEFRPERFEEKRNDVRGQHFHLLPFGSGRRMCPGTSLGLLTVHATLGAMIQCFEWKAGKDGNLTSVDMEEGPAGITIPRANPLVCVQVARLNPIPLFS